MIEKMTATKAIEKVKGINSIEELNSLKTSEESGKNRATVLKAIDTRIEFVNNRNKETGVEVVDEKKTTETPNTNEVAKTTHEVEIVPETIASKIFNKLSKEVDKLEKAKKLVSQDKYIIKDVKDEEGLKNVKELKKAVYALRKTATDLKSDSRAPFKQTYDLIGSKIDEFVAKVKETEEVLKNRIDAIEEAKREAKAEKERQARAKLLAEENEKLEKEREALAKEREELENAKANLEKLYPGIIAKSKEKKAERENTIEVGTTVQESSSETTPEAQQVLEPKDAIIRYLTNLQMLPSKIDRPQDEFYGKMYDSITNNVEKVVKHFTEKIK